MVDAGFNVKAEEAMRKADKKIKGSFFGNIFSNKQERAEQAIEYYKSAANNYKLAKMWDEAGKAYLRMADCEQMIGSHEGADHLVEAANMLKKINTADAITYMEKAADMYCSDGRIMPAARLKKQIAETYDQDSEYTLASKYYQEAADLYYAENDRSSDYNNMRLKVADLSIYIPDANIGESIKYYEEIAERYLENKLTEPSAKNLYFKACLLYLLNDDSVGCAIALQKYTDKSPSFAGTRQQKFIETIIQCVEKADVQGFSAACKSHNEIIPFDKWATKVLVGVKNKIPGAQLDQPVPITATSTEDQLKEYL